MATANGREIYRIGNKAAGNREVAIVEDGEEHDFPAEAETTYADINTRFPYELEV